MMQQNAVEPYGYLVRMPTARRVTVRLHYHPKPWSNGTEPLTYPFTAVIGSESIPYHIDLIETPMVRPAPDSQALDGLAHVLQAALAEKLGDKVMMFGYKIILWEVGR